MLHRRQEQTGISGISGQPVPRSICPEGTRRPDWQEEGPELSPLGKGRWLETLPGAQGPCWGLAGVPGAASSWAGPRCPAPVRPQLGATASPLRAPVNSRRCSFRKGLFFPPALRQGGCLATAELSAASLSPRSRPGVLAPGPRAPRVLAPRRFSGPGGSRRWKRTARLRQTPDETKPKHPFSH